MSKKYPRTPHFPHSPGATRDDRILSEGELESFIGPDLIFTEKLDGSNVCLTCNDLFSRSHAGPPAHVSFEPLKKLHAIIKREIPSGISVFGEWCYAVHSITYSILNHHLNIFGVRNDETGQWWNWEDVEYMAKILDIPTVPVILNGPVKNPEHLKSIVQTLGGLNSVYGLVREGLVVRFADNVVDDGERIIGLAKWVRADHVQTSEHWTRQVVKKQNSLRR